MSCGSCLVFVFAVASTCFAWAQSPVVNLMYLERPPYATNIGGNNKPHGLLIEPIEKAFQVANIPYRWVEVPVVRQLAVLRSNEDLDCGVGWFYRDQRKAFSKYSKAFFQDLPTVGIVAKDSTLPGSLKIKDLLTEGKVSWTVMDGFSYDPYVENLMKEHKITVQVVNGNFGNLVNMIDKNRAMITLLAKQEAQYYAEQKEFKGRLRIIDFTDVPPGEARYLICSFKVSDELMEKINKSLQKSHLTVKK